MEAAEATAGDMDVAEAPEASAESAAGAGSRPKPADWEAMTQSQKGRWNKTQNRKQRKGPGT